MFSQLFSVGGRLVFIIDGQACVSLHPLRLCARILAVAAVDEKGAMVADIGSDHAYSPLYVIKEGIVQKAVAGEVAIGPFESAMNNVVRQGIMDQVTVRLANGLAAVDENDGVDTVTIAGMGGSLIATILMDGIEKLLCVKRIYLQPNIVAKGLR